MHTHSHKHLEATAILVENLSISFNQQPVLKNVSFEVAKGRLVAILGPNGSGKTTLMRALLGLQPYQQGVIRLFNEPISAHYGNIGYVPQKFAPDKSVPMTVGEFLDIARDRRTPIHRLNESLEEVGLNPVSARAKQMATLSGGQLQRVLIARAIMHHPDLLFLDEPSTGIDIAGEQTLFELIGTLNKKHGMTVIMISHEVNMIAASVDQVLCLNTSLVCSGPPNVALTKDSLTQLYGSDYVASHQHKHV
ncbi:TPA: ABC transporter ATP-binding protein [Candidatus Uhrbacteria bacterium]|nr:ABC transporter ATP-binding protein [Candidatus Uhrbacteria bacterium]